MNIFSARLVSISGLCFLLFGGFTAITASGEEIKIVSPSPYADMEAPGGALHGGPSNARLQQVFTAEDFMSLPEGNRVLTAISFRADGEGEGTGLSTYISSQIIMSTTEKEVGELSPTYEENLGDDRVTVYEGNYSRVLTHSGPVGGPKEFDEPVPLQTLFVYDPNAGNLLLDWRWFDQVRNGNVSFDFLEDTNQNFTQYIWGSASSPVSEFSTGGAIWEFTFVPEPSTFLLSLLGLSAAGMTRRHRR